MMSKDNLDISSHDKNAQKFPARISSKVPVQIAMHSRNNSSGYEGHHSYKTEKIHDYDIPLVKPIAINALSRNPKDEPLSSSYHSYFSLGQTPSNSSTSSSTTLKAYYNNNNSTDYPFKFDEDDFPKYKNIIDNKMPINPFEYNESVTMAVLNSEGYTNKSCRSSETSPEFEFDKDLRGYSKSYNDKDIIDIKSLKNKDNLKSYTLDSNNSKSKEEKMYKKLVSGEMIFSPDDSPIIIPDKPSTNKVDMSKSVLFKNSNSSTDSLSSNGSYSHSGKKRVSIKKTRNSINLSRTRSSSLGGRGRIDYDDYPLFNLDNHPADVRSYSLPRRSIDIHRIDTSSSTRARSNTLPRSLIISPAKDEKFFVCTSPRKDCYNVQDLPTVKAMEYEKRNNYKSYDDDKGSFIYNQSELVSPSVCDVIEYRNFLKAKSYDIPDASEERKHRSLSRRRESRYRSLSRGSDNEKSESKRRSRSRSRSKTRNKGERQNSPVKTMDDESRYRSLSKSRKDSKDDERVEKIEKERQERMEKEHKDNKERKRATSKHKKHRKNKSSSNHDSPLVKSSPIVRNNSRGSNVGSPLIKKETRPNNINSPLVRKDSRGSNVGSPLVIKESYSSPLAPSSMTNKFSTSYIQNEYNRSSYDNRNKNDFPNINNSDDDDNSKNINQNSRTLAETQNKDIINEICDLKKFSQDFSSLNILESILNRPIEDDFEFLNYDKSDNQKYSTLTRLPSQGKRRSKSRDIKRRNSDMDYNKGHQRTSSEQLRSDDNGSGKGNKRNIFNFFSHKKSKSYSSSPEKNKAPDFDKLIQGNETLKLTLQPTSKLTSPYISKATIDGYSSDSDSDINNEEYSTSYKNFIKEKMMNQQQNQYNPQQNQYNQPINNIKDYTPLFRINVLNNPNNNINHQMDFYGAKKDIPANPYDQFNDFSIDEGERRSFNNKYASLGRYNKHGSKRMNY